ncbi:MAG: CocE/NonD family hydrolase, partial [Pirellula sp.]
MKAKFAMIPSKQCNLYRHFRATCLAAIWACVFQVVLLDGQSRAQLDNKPQTDPRADYIRANYTKSEVRIRMRDGVELFTSIYAPNDPDPSKKYPILLSRTPYSVGPYGLSSYKTRLGPSPEFERNRYIFVFQDVRGRYMSGGEFVNMRPHVPKVAGSIGGIDESTDTYDTIEYLVKSLPGNNGHVGQWGI